MCFLLAYLDVEALGHTVLEEITEGQIVHLV